MHDASRHLCVAGISAQPPEPSHMPWLPHGIIQGHCPDGAVVPALMGAQAPLGSPVSASEHAMQVPLHAELQHRPPTQKPLRHWLLAVHAAPDASSGTQAPLAVPSSR